MKLDEFRQRLSDIDAKILDLVAERQKVVDGIGAVKRDVGQATRDFAREKQVLEMADERARQLGISPGLARSLLEQLILNSLTNQEQARVRASGHGKGRQALVIGGAGKMGRWFVSFLYSQGFSVTVADPGSPPAGFEHVESWRSTKDEFDVTELDRVKVKGFGERTLFSLNATRTSLILHTDGTIDEASF